MMSSFSSPPSNSALALLSASQVCVSVIRLAHAPQNLPAYATPGSAGMDLQAAIDTPWTLAPMERRLIPTGFIILVPEGYEAQVRARSGLSVKHGVTLINGVGTIDSDYRDELKIALVNLSDAPYTVTPGQRVAQLLVAPVHRITWQTVEASEVAGTARQGGFGSTGA
jgi:dUTP pyrophosphatase